jgi:hypothetical protein
MPAMADKVIDIAEILADQQELWALMAEPLLPVAEHIGIEIEFAAAAKSSGAALDADPASLASGDERAPFLHALPAPLVPEAI